MCVLRTALLLLALWPLPQRGAGAAAPPAPAYQRGSAFPAEGVHFHLGYHAEKIDSLYLLQARWGHPLANTSAGAGAPALCYLWCYRHPMFAVRTGFEHLGIRFPGPQCFCLTGLPRRAVRPAEAPDAPWRVYAASRVPPGGLYAAPHPPFAPLKRVTTQHGCRAPTGWPADRVFAFTFLSGEMDLQTFSFVSAVVNGVDWHVYGYRDAELNRKVIALGKSIARLFCYREIIGGLPPKTLVMHTDAADVMWNRGLDTLPAQFRAFRADMVFGAEKMCAGVPHMPESPGSPYQCLNGGGWVGTAGAVRQALAWVLAHRERVLNSTHKYSPALLQRDQLWWGLLQQASRTHYRTHNSSGTSGLPRVRLDEQGDLVLNRGLLKDWALCPAADADLRRLGAPAADAGRRPGKDCGPDGRVPLVVHHPGPFRHHYPEALPSFWWVGRHLPALADATLWVGGQRVRLADVAPQLHLFTDANVAAALRRLLRGA